MEDARTDLADEFTDELPSIIIQMRKKRQQGDKN